MKEEDMEPTDIGNGVVLLMHKKDICRSSCPVHSPSNHHMVSWPLHWRSDRMIFERICDHGIGHPDPDTIAFIAKTSGKTSADMEAIHGCDGCCVKRSEAEEDMDLVGEYNRGM